MVFVLVGQKEQVLDPLIERAFSSSNMKVGPAQWLLSVPGTPTSKEVWTKLIEGAPEQPTGMVFPLSGYFGYASNSIWEWITAKRQTDL